MEELTNGMVGRNVLLRPLMQEDYRTLYAIETQLELDGFWHLQGEFLGPEAYAQSIWRGVLLQLMVISRHTSAPLGLVRVYNASPLNRHASLMIVGPRHARERGLLIQGAILMIDYVFQTWDFHKLYGESIGDNAESFLPGPNRLFTAEGRMRDHVRHRGRFLDMVTLALYREQWLEARDRYLPYVAMAAHMASDRTPSSSPLEFGAFASQLERAAAMSHTPSERDESLVSDLSMDSLGLVGAVSMIYELTGEEIPSDLLAVTETIGELYDFYCAAASRAAQI